MAVAAYENWRHGPADLGHSIAEADRILRQPPQEYNNQVYLDRVVKSYGQDASVPLLKNVDQLARLMSAARDLGSRVLLFELPYTDQLNETRVALDTRRIVSSRFDDSHDWLHLPIDESELRWPDGTHMDERSAVLTARAIERALQRSTDMSR